MLIHLTRFESIIHTLANELVDEFSQAGQADLKNVFALPLPHKVVSMTSELEPERWEWICKNLALFDRHAAMASGSFNEKIEGIIEPHRHIAYIIQQREMDRRDYLMSHIGDERDAGVLEMTNFELLRMIPGVLLVGHETTTDPLSTVTMHLLRQGL